MYSETFLEVLGADLGIQDLLCHGTGEPASLLIMQSLTKDPPCKEVSRVRSSTGAGTGVGEARLGLPLGEGSPLYGEQGLSHAQEFSISKGQRLGTPPKLRLPLLCARKHMQCKEPGCRLSHEWEPILNLDRLPQDWRLEGPLLKEAFKRPT